MLADLLARIVTSHVTHHAMATAVVQAFAHPQARFLYEKMWQVSPRRRSPAGRLIGGINYVSYGGIHSAMAMGVVSSACLQTLSASCCLREVSIYDATAMFAFFCANHTRVTGLC